LSQELDINLKTVAKWRKRATVEDMKTGPKEPRSAILKEEKEAAVVAFRRPMRFYMICEVEPRLRHRSERPWRGGIEHRLTKLNHRWTNGQVERMNRTIKDATVKRYNYDSHDQLRTHLADLLAAYNFARRLKTLGGLTPYEYICKI
jgi:hypothetical protein